MTLSRNRFEPLLEHAVLISKILSVADFFTIYFAVINIRLN